MISLKLSSRYGLTYVIITLNVLVYVYTAILGGDFINISDAPLRLYGQVNASVMQGWYIYQLFTSLFVHANIVHLAGNMFFFLIFGLRAEELFDSKQYLLIYFLSGLAGNLLSLAVDLGSYTPDVGASGAIFGIFGACIIYVARARAVRSIGRSIIGALAFAFFLLLMSAGPNVNSIAHLGGLVIGLLIGYALATRRKTRTGYGFNYSYSVNAGHGRNSISKKSPDANSSARQEAMEERVFPLSLCAHLLTQGAFSARLER
jgi:rhomboid protease GluP